MTTKEQFSLIRKLRRLLDRAQIIGMHKQSIFDISLEAIRNKEQSASKLILAYETLLSTAATKPPIKIKIAQLSFPSHHVDISPTELFTPIVVDTHFNIIEGHNKVCYAHDTGHTHIFAHVVDTPALISSHHKLIELYSEIRNRVELIYAIENLANSTYGHLCDIPQLEDLSYKELRDFFKKYLVIVQERKYAR